MQAHRLCIQPFQKGDRNEKPALWKTGRQGYSELLVLYGLLRNISRLLKMKITHAHGEKMSHGLQGSRAESHHASGLFLIPLFSHIGTDAFPDSIIVMQLGRLTRVLLTTCNALSRGFSRPRVTWRLCLVFPVRNLQPAPLSASTLQRFCG